MGKHITAELLRAGKHKVTALTRSDSTTAIPSGVEIKRISYSDHGSLVAALQGQDALIITMNTRAPPEQQTQLIDAAPAPKLPWELPNEYGYDTLHRGLHDDIPLGKAHAAYREQIAALGVSAYVGVTCGFWYEYSLSASPACYGFDLQERSVTFFDDGDTRINTSTLPQCGRAVANLLALKILPEDEGDDGSACLSRFKNKFVYVSSFRVSQRDMLDSVMRVTGTKVDDWSVGHEASVDRYRAGCEELKRGNFVGFPQLMYTRVFYQDGSGDFEASRGLQNEVLGLPDDDLDEYTKIALQMPRIF